MMNKNILLKNIIDAQKNGDIESDLALETIDFIMASNLGTKQTLQKKHPVKNDTIIKTIPKNFTSKTELKKDKCKFKITKTTDDCFSITSVGKVGEKFYTKPTFVTFKIKYNQFKNILDEEGPTIKYGKTVYAILNFDKKNKKVTPYSVYINDRKYNHEDNISKNTYLKSLTKNNVGHFGEALLYTKLVNAVNKKDINIEHTADINLSAPCDITISNNKKGYYYYVDVKSVVHEGLNLQIKSDQFNNRWDCFQDKDFYYCLVKTNWKNEGNKTGSISQSFIHIKDVKKHCSIQDIDRYGRKEQLIIVNYYSNRNLFIEFDDFIKRI